MPDTWKMAKMNMAIRGIDADLGSYQCRYFYKRFASDIKGRFYFSESAIQLSSMGTEKN